MTPEHLLEVRDLEVAFRTHQGMSPAVLGVSLFLDRGETLGIVGESGSGKTITALSLPRLLPRGAEIVGGQVRFAGEDLLAISEQRMRAIRGREIGIILQDSLVSLNPLFKVRFQIAEALRKDLGRHERRHRVAELLRLVGIQQTGRGAERRYPFQLSGGMRQRVVGAVALSRSPKLLIADEATTSLDVIVEREYLRLLKRLQSELQFGLILITHNISIVDHMCDRVAVMYRGRIVETGPVRDVLSRPAHPYTEALLDSVPSIDRPLERLRPMSRQNVRSDTATFGCPYAPYCPHVFDRCVEEPPLLAVDGNTSARCWRTGSSDPTAVSTPGTTFAQVGDAPASAATREH